MRHRRMRVGAGIAAAAILLLLESCATIMHGTTQGIPISSEPSEADVLVDGQPYGTTPTVVEMKRKSDHVVRVEKEGYQAEEMVVMHVVSGAVAGNILFGGLIGWGVDASTGAQYRLVPKTLQFTLDPVGSEPSEEPPPIDLNAPEVRLQRLADLLSQGLITQDEYDAMKAIILKEAQVQDEDLEPQQPEQGSEPQPPEEDSEL